MDTYERTLLEWSLPCARSLLIYGAKSSAADVTDALRKLAGRLETHEVRAGAIEEAALRRQLRESFARAPTVLLLVASPMPQALRAIATQVQRGEWKEGEEAPRLPDGARLVAFLDAKECSHDDARCFDLHVIGMRVLEAQRARVAADAAELLRRQARARESSRQHGLV